MKILLACFFSVMIFGCTKSDHEEHPERSIQVDDIPKEIRIPTGLWDRIEGKVETDAHGGKTAEGHEAPAAVATEDENVSGGALFMPVTVTLVEKNPGVLTDSPLVIHLPRGGGTIDLEPYMKNQDGSFFVRFDWPELEPTDEFQAWFVSKSHRRRLGDEVWGSGCGRFYRITKSLQQAMRSEGLKVNTTRNRHLTVLGGHFIFSAKRKGQIFLTQVTFKDSRHENLYCEEL